MDREGVLREALTVLRAYLDADLLRLAGERRLDVAEWRWTAELTSPQHPEPFFDERAGKEAAWLDAPAPFGGAAVGVDDDGRPVLAEVRWSALDTKQLNEVWFHGDGWSDVVTRNGASRVVFADGRVVAKVSTRGDDAELAVFTWDDERPVRSDSGASDGSRAVSEAYVARYDDGGRLLRLSRGVEIADVRDADALPAVIVALERAAAVVPDHDVFDARTARHPDRLRASDEVVAILGPAVEEAVAAAVRESGVERPFVVELRLREHRFPPFVTVGGEQFRARTIALSPPEGVLALLHAARPPAGARVSVLDYLEDDALAVCRELNAALSHERGLDDPERVRASELSQRLGRDWALRLNKREWPGASRPFLVLVRVGRQYEDVDPFELALPGAGYERIDAFRSSIGPRTRTSGIPDDARTDRRALLTWLEERGLGADAARVAATAQHAFRLRPAGDEVQTRLGGTGLLPPAEDWPHAAGDRPLTFLAGVDLSELRPGRPLPEAGWLLFFADLDNDEALGLIEPVANEPGSPARVFHVAAGDEPVEAAPPARLRDVLAERRVAAVPQLTLPDDYEFAERLGLDPAEKSICEDVAYQLRYDGRGRLEVGDHWILGAVTGVQGHPVEPDTVLLLHLEFDRQLGFEFLDGGAIQFRIPGRALAERDWAAVTIEPDSG
ncbi:MAG TPA: YwqG family protein [Thermoleophilaceae bacterium]|nr:YwqG family protein [Thermoleophilaceae bacterium]